MKKNVIFNLLTVAIFTISLLPSSFLYAQLSIGTRSIFYEGTSTFMVNAGNSPLGVAINGSGGTVNNSLRTSDGSNSLFNVAHPSNQVVAIGGNNDHVFQIGGFQNDLSAFTPRMTILTDGNVGIGTTTPSQKLDVVGSINISSGQSYLINNKPFLQKKSDQSVMVGQLAGRFTTGGVNTFVGDGAGKSNTTGSFNAFFGTNAGGTSTGGNNVFLGALAGELNTSGSQNTFVGGFSGRNNGTANGNTFVGYNVQSFNGSAGNSAAFGANSVALNSNETVIGNVAMLSIYGYSNFAVASDERFKTNVQENVVGLDFILKLRPVTYRYKAQQLNQLIQPQTSSTKRNAKDASYNRALLEKSKITYTGFLAQEVATIAEENDFNFSGIISPKHANDHYKLRYASFVVPLVKATQEQQKIIQVQGQKINKQEQAIADQNNKISDLENEVAELSTLIKELLAQSEENPTGSNHELHLKKAPSLNQNQPNPFRENTLVNYFIPNTAKNAHIQVTSVDGKVLGTVNIPEKGQGQVTINAATYPAGTYYYSLIVDGEVFETKRMVLTK